LSAKLGFDTLRSLVKRSYDCRTGAFSFENAGYRRK